MRLASDMAAEARAAAAARVPLVVYYSEPGCPFCERASRDYLEPLAADPAQAARLRFTHVDIASPAPLRDFEGRAATHAAFARAQGVRVVPTLTFHGALGRSVAPPLVGFTVPDFYLQYLERRLDDARAALAK